MTKPAAPEASRHHKADNIYRKFLMLRQIPLEPHWKSTAEITSQLAAEGYHCTPRTVQRDLSALSIPFGYTSEQRGNALVWFWPRHTRDLSLRSLDPASALTLHMAGEYLRHLLPSSTLTAMESYFTQARDTLQALQSPGLGSWTTKVRVIHRGPLVAPPVVQPAVQEAVYQALLQQRVIEARYRGRGAREAKSTRLHPLGIVAKEGVLYLVATAWDYTDPYQYALHRFEQAQVQAEAARRPPDFDLDHYIHSQRAFRYPLGEGPIKLKMAFSPESVAPVLERPLSADQQSRQRRDGRWLIEATVQNDAELHWWILGLGHHVEVLGPASLRKIIAAQIELAAGRYRTSSAA